jgi:hypothetical protein
MSINSLITPWPQRISEVMTNIDREIVILPCQRFWSPIEAVVESIGDLIKQMCM